MAARIDRHYAQYGDGHITCGRKPGPDDIQLATNDYLALTRDGRILESQLGALATPDQEVYMSGVFVQYLEAQRKLERQFASFVGSEDAVICQSGFSANEGLIQSIADPTTPVYLDMFAHASLWQGARAAQAPAHMFRHNDVDHLRSQVRQHGPGVVVVDSIYSISGDVCRIEDVLDVCEEEGCTLVVDESHAIGILGERGQGLVASLGLGDRVPFRTFSLSKAFVGRGGVICASSRFVDYFRYESWPAIFSSVILPWDIARFARTLEVIQDATESRRRLFRLADQVRGNLIDSGYDVSTSQTQIIPLVAGPEERTKQLRDALESRGVFGSVFCAPATPRNRSLVRLCINVGLGDDDVVRLIDVCKQIRPQVQPETWPSLFRHRNSG